MVAVFVGGWQGANMSMCTTSAEPMLSMRMTPAEQESTFAGRRAVWSPSKGGCAHLVNAHHIFRAAQ